MIRSLQQIFQTLFHFTSTDRGAFIVLIPLLLLLAGWPRIFLKNGISDSDFPPDMEYAADSIYRNWNSSAENDHDKLSPSPFDPNKISLEGFRSMGLDSPLAARIVRYREKGGKFRKREDLFRIWGMDSAVASELMPFVRLHADSVRKSVHPVKKELVRIQYDLNLADTADFESVHGIGRKMAARIIRYRTALGGFIHKDQLYEVFGIDSLAVFSMDAFYIAPDFVPVTIDINHATYEVLESHPYLSPMHAKAILFYRYQHGNFITPEKLSDVKRIDTKTLERLRPYIRSSVP